MRTAVFYAMDWACLLTGHWLFLCYNGNRRLNRIWYWANGPF